MLLSELLKDIPHEIVKGGDKIEISGISLNSRQMKPGFVFVAKKGAVADGNFYIEDAAERGAVAVFTTEVPKLIPENLTIVKMFPNPQSPIPNPQEINDLMSIILKIIIQYLKIIFK